jgi:aspartate racemase
MKILGLIGGISWVSTVDYYKYINQMVNEKLGGNHFAECIIYSLNYGEVIAKSKANDNDGILKMVTAACMHLQNSGADAILLCANTMHLLYDELQHRVDLPILHIADATAGAIKKQQLKKVALLGTKPTMELDFYKNKLLEHGIEAIVPGSRDRAFIGTSIDEELARGILEQTTKDRYLTIIQELVSEGAEGIILGCTEIPLLIQQDDCEVPVFDTTFIHASYAVDFAFS